MALPASCGVSIAECTACRCSNASIVFIRSLSLHLQICWQVSTGRKFFFASLLGGWGIPALSLGLSLALSGVSYRFGNTCHINHEKSLGAFWIPLLVFTGLAAILQLVTFAYCIRVYLQNLMDSNTASATSSNLPSHHGGSSIRTASARAAYRRIRKVVALQWRGIMVVIIMIISVVDFSIVFLKLDAMQAQAQEAGVNGGMRPWLACLVANRGDKNKCLDKIDGVILSEPIIVATIYLLSFLGFWCLLFLGRVAMASGWLDVLRRPFRPRDFVSVDARRLSLSDPRNYEMLTSPQSNVESPGKKSPGAPLLAFSKEIASPSLGASPQSASDYFPARETAFRERSLSFSQPRPPSRAASKGSQRVTFSREGPSSPPLDAMPKNWSSMTGDTDTTAWPSLVAPSSPKPQQEQPHQQQHWQSHSQRHSPNLHQQQHHQQSPPQTAPAHAANSSLWERSSSALSNGSRSGSALGREYAGAALGREWLRTSPVPAGPPPLRRTNSALGRDREWDPRTTYARGTGAGAGDHGAF